MKDRLTILRKGPFMLKRSRDHSCGTGGVGAGAPGHGLRLSHPLQLLHPASRPGRDQRGRPREPPATVDRGLPGHASGGSCLLHLRVAVLPGRLHPLGQPVLRPEPAPLLCGSGVASPGGPPLDRPGLLRVGQRVRPLRGGGLLGVHRRPLPQSAGEEGLRFHRGGILPWRDRRLFSDHSDRQPGSRLRPSSVGGDSTGSSRLVGLVSSSEGRGGSDRPPG